MNFYPAASYFESNVSSYRIVFHLHLPVFPWSVCCLHKFICAFVGKYPTITDSALWFKVCKMQLSRYKSAMKSMVYSVCCKCTLSTVGVSLFVIWTLLENRKWLNSTTHRIHTMRPSCLFPKLTLCLFITFIFVALSLHSRVLTRSIHHHHHSFLPCFVCSQFTMESHSMH